jgi:hypothetical protein
LSSSFSLAIRSHISTTSSLQGVRSQEVDTSTLSIGITQGISQGNAFDEFWRI